MAKKKTSNKRSPQHLRPRLPERSNTSSRVDAAPESHEAAQVEPLVKIMLRLPQSLAHEFQQVYLQLAARHLAQHGKKLLLQDLHCAMLREWLAQQKHVLATAPHFLNQ